MMKPVQFFGVLPVCPSEKLAMRGAVVQFIIPGLKISGEELNSFQKIAVACGDGVESAHFKRVHSDPDKHPATLVSIAFHVSDGAESEESAHTTGRLIAERFLSLVSYSIGERVVGLHQQVSVAKDGGAYTVRLHPQRKWADNARRIGLPKALAEVRPDSGTFKALFWLRRGLSDHDPLDAFAALMVAMEILASVLVPAEDIVSRCPKCGEEIGKRTTNSLRRLLTDTLRASDNLFDRLWSTRNAVVAHGGRAVTAEVLQQVVELRLEAIQLVFQALGLALQLPPDAVPRPAQIVMFTDPFLNAE